MGASQPKVSLVPPLYSSVPSGRTMQYTATLKDLGGNLLTPSQLTSLTLTLVDTVSREIVNEVNEVNILNTGRGTLNSQGLLTITLTGDDTLLLNSSDATEGRSMVIDWQYPNAGNTITGGRQVDFEIEALVGP